VSLPLELMTLAASTVGSGIMTLLALRMKMKAQQQAALMSKVGVAQENRMEVLTGVPDKVAWTRRTIALSVVLSVIVLPKLAALFVPDLHVSYGWTETTTGWLWGLFGGNDQSLMWHEVKGLAITPLDTHVAMMIAGLYFGPSIVKNA